VLLADVDLQAGLIDFLTKTTSPYSIADAANNVQRLDESYWRALVSNGIPNLEIIAAPSKPAGKQISGAQLKQVLAFARMQYDWTVLDMGRNLNAASLSMLDVIDETYLVTTHEIPALHQSKRMIQFLMDCGYPRSNLRVVMNRSPKRPDITIPELEGMLGAQVYALIGNDYASLQETYADGGFVDRSSRLGQSFAELSARIAGVDLAKKKSFSIFG
jgi:pilus assembly protein CpaE